MIGEKTRMTDEEFLAEIPQVRERVANALDRIKGAANSYIAAIECGPAIFRQFQNRGISHYTPRPGLEIPIRRSALVMGDRYRIRVERKKRKKVTREQVAVWFEEYKAGMTLIEIGERYDRSDGVIRNNFLRFFPEEYDRIKRPRGAGSHRNNMV